MVTYWNSPKQTNCKGHLVTTKRRGGSKRPGKIYAPSIVSVPQQGFQEHCCRDRLINSCDRAKAKAFLASTRSWTGLLSLCASQIIKVPKRSMRVCWLRLRSGTKSKCKLNSKSSTSYLNQTSSSRRLSNRWDIRVLLFRVRAWKWTQECKSRPRCKRLTAHFTELWKRIQFINRTMTSWLRATKRKSWPLFHQGRIPDLTRVVLHLPLSHKTTRL